MRTLRADGSGFVAVELDCAETQRFCQRDNRCGIPVDEDADGGNERGEFAENFPGIGGGEAARTLFIEVEAEGVGAEFDGEAGVFEAGDAADFDARYWLVFHGAEMALRLGSHAANELEVYVEILRPDESGLRMTRGGIRGSFGVRFSMTIRIDIKR